MTPIFDTGLQSRFGTVPKEVISRREKVRMYVCDVCGMGERIHVCVDMVEAIYVVS